MALLSMSTSRARSLAWIAAVALVYFTVARLSLLLLFEPTGIAAIWPAEGIFLSALLLSRRELWPWLAGTLFIADLIAELLAGTPVPVSIVFSLSLTGSAVLSAWLLQRFAGRSITLQTSREVMGFLLLAVVVTNAVMSACAAAASTWIAGEPFWTSWALWATSDGVGNLIVTPLILSWAHLLRAGLKPMSQHRKMEAAGLFLGLVSVGIVALGYRADDGQFSFLLTYALVPFLLWATLRFRTPGASAAMFMVASIAVYFNLVDSPWQSVLPVTGFISLQLYLAIVAVCLLFLAAVVNERTQGAADLQESESRYARAVAGANDGIWEWTPATGEDYLSPRWKQLLGYEDHELPNVEASFFDAIHAEDRPRISEAVRAHLEQRQPYAVEMRMRCKNGAYRWFACRAQAEWDDQGRPLRMAGSISDITERKQVETERALLEEQLRESHKMQAMGTLAGGIAHDFNNIIGTILGNADLARQDAHGNPEVLQSVEEIRKAGTRARDLVKQILFFSRKQSDGRKRMALAPVIEESRRLLRATLPARVLIDVHCDDEAPDMMGDVSQVQQVLINLATNCMQAMGKAPGRISIRLVTVMLDASLAQTHPALAAMAARRPGRTLRLAVSDDGPGMDAATVKRIFEPFFTTKPVGEGTGLGLSVVLGIVQGHEGTIVVESTLGKGATFTVYLPAVTEAQAQVAEDVREAPSATPHEGSGRRILFVDDDETVVLLIKRVLERRGYRVSAHTDQAAALAALRVDPAAFDLVVSDYNMPGKSGLEVAREVRAIRADLPVAIMSGYIDDALRAQSKSAGVRELVFKAHASEELCDVLARLVQTAGPASVST